MRPIGIYEDIVTGKHDIFLISKKDQYDDIYLTIYRKDYDPIDVSSQQTICPEQKRQFLQMNVMEKNVTL